MLPNHYKIFTEKVYEYLKRQSKYNQKSNEELMDIINDMWKNNYKFSIDDLDDDAIEYML